MNNMQSISSWGRLSDEPHQIIPLNNKHQVPNSALLGLAYGNGRSYGDVCLNPNQTLWLTKDLDRFISFDAPTGLLTCEPGVLLGNIQNTMIPQGWCLPVSPGTQFVTVGGAIANDIHGKNHHVCGSFGNHIQSIKLLRTDGKLIECSKHQNPDWFAATIGGLGLTGLITEVQIKLRPTLGPWLESETLAYNNLDEFFYLADTSEAYWEHTVSWVDCSAKIGATRGIFMRANPSASKKNPPHTKPQKAVPFVPPFSLINPISLKLLNSLYYRIKKQQVGLALIHYKSFFYPLDGIKNWNKIYGPKGFFQYQSVVPPNVSKDATQEMLKAIKQSAIGSFLAVLKTFSTHPSLGMLSFPQPGVTLALDFPNYREHTHKLFKRLDSIVREAQGRIYLAKDARQSRELFEAGYPRLQEFLQYRDPGIQSGLSRRLMGD